MDHHKTLFSIIIPTYNRPEQLLRCLGSLKELRFPVERYEVIVVNDGGSSAHLESIKASHDGVPLSVYTQDHGGPAAARNYGSARATGDYLIFLDDDCSVAPDWLLIIEKQTRCYSGAVLGGSTINILSQNTYSAASQLLIDYIYSYYNQDAQRALFFTSNNLIIPRSTSLSMKGFDTSFAKAAAEDRDLCNRLAGSGIHLVYIPEIVVFHAHTLSLRTYWRQQYNYGRGAFHYQKLKSDRTRQRLKVEPWYFYKNLILYPFTKKSDEPVTSSLLLGLSQLANAMGFFIEWFYSMKNR